jgi:hypothetical protein
MNSYTTAYILLAALYVFMGCAPFSLPYLAVAGVYLALAALSAYKSGA